MGKKLMTQKLPLCYSSVLELFTIVPALRKQSAWDLKVVRPALNPQMKLEY